jgi:Uncharacterised nucleotidyltransferase
MDEAQVRIEHELIDEASRLLAAAEAEGVQMRLLGGAGVRLLLGERLHPRFQREIDDLDFITTRKAGPAVERLLQREGWQPQARFNALHGHRRLLFEDPLANRKLDVFVERFEMCHSLPLARRLEVHAKTLPGAEMAMTKLQIVEVNAKDLLDLYALLDALEVAEHDQDAINAGRIAELTRGDWGLHHTFELNLQRLLEGVQSAGFDDDRAKRVTQRIEALRQAMDGASKTRAWRLRARIGERKRWYEEPEEADR